MQCTVFNGFGEVWIAGTVISHDGDVLTCHVLVNHLPPPIEKEMRVAHFLGNSIAALEDLNEDLYELKMTVSCPALGLIDKRVWAPHMFEDSGRDILVLHIRG